MNINYDYEDMPLPDDVPTCPHCESTYVKFVTYTQVNDIQVVLYECRSCNQPFTTPMPDIPY